MSLVFMQVGGKSGMKRGEYRMEDPGEQSVATPVGLSMEEGGHIKLLPLSSWVFCLGSKLNISLIQSVVCEIPNLQEVVDSSPSRFVDNGFGIRW